MTVCFRPRSFNLHTSVSFLMVPSGLAGLKTKSPLNPIIDLIVCASSLNDISLPVPMFYILNLINFPYSHIYLKLR